MSSSSRPQRVLLTGATGFIGRRLVRWLLRDGFEVAVLVLPGEVALSSAVEVYEGDITDPATVARAVAAAQPDRVYHLAAVGLTHPNLPMSQACEVNVGGLINLLEALRPLDHLERVILVGTSYVYGARRSDDGLDPFNAYSASKAAAWAFARAAYNAWSMPLVWVRPFQVYGPGQHPHALISAAIRAALAGDDFPMSGGEQQRDFIYVDDVVRGLTAVAEAPGIEGRVLDLATGTLRRIRDVVEQIWTMADASGRMVVGALPYRDGEVPAIPADVQRIRVLTGWEASVSLEEGLRLTIEAFHADRATEGVEIDVGCREVDDVG